MKDPSLPQPLIGLPILALTCHIGTLICSLFCSLEPQSVPVFMQILHGFAVPDE